MCDDVFEMEKHVNAIHAIYNGLDKTFDEQDDAATKIEMEIASQLSSLNLGIPKRTNYFHELHLQRDQSTREIVFDLI